MQSNLSDRCYSASSPVRPGTTNSLCPEISSDLLLDSPSVAIRAVDCRGTCRDRSAEEHGRVTSLVFTYRGTYVRHVGQNQSVAEANQVLFFNAAESYRVSHPLLAAMPASLSSHIPHCSPRSRLLRCSTTSQTAPSVLTVIASMPALRLLSPCFAIASAKAPSNLSRQRASP
jgi:hypothetical protein